MTCRLARKKVFWAYFKYIFRHRRFEVNQNKKKKIEHLTTSQTQLKREISVFSGVSIVGGIMIGSGIFYIGSYVLERTGMSLGLSLLAWLVGGLVSLLGGFCFAELGASMPRAGGSTVYLNEAYHPIAGFLRGFTDWIIGGPGSVAAMAIALPTAMQSFFDISEMHIKLIAVAIIIFLTIVNFFGVKRGSTLQNYSMVAKLVPIFIIMFAALFLGKESPSITFKPMTENSASIFQIIKMVSFATIASLWAYEGWSNINSMYESSFEKEGNTLRHGLIHCQITDRALMERIAKLNIPVFYQPIFLDYDMHIVEERVGKELASTSYAFKTAVDLNIPVGYGTDAPVEDLNPFPCIYSAVTRCDKNGFPEDGFYPDEKVDVEQAIDNYTIGSAYCEFQEHTKGRIKEGYLADFTVLDRDIFTIDPMDIIDMKADMTIIGGEIVYSL